MLKKVFFAGIVLINCLIFNSFSYAQTVVNNNQTVEQYVQNVLIGVGVSVSNIQFNGGPANIVSESVGEFTAPVGYFGIGSGFMMGSGDVNLAEQPNTGGGSSLGPKSIAD